MTLQRSADRAAIHGRSAPRQSRRQLAHADTLIGGWWCAVADVDAVPETTKERAAALPPVLPLVTATPRYPIAGDSRSEAGARRDVLLRRRDGLHRRAGDHRALGRSVPRADPGGARAARATRRGTPTACCGRVAAATSSASTGSRSTRSSSTFELDASRYSPATRASVDTDLILLRRRERPEPRREARGLPRRQLIDAPAELADRALRSRHSARRRARP